MLELKCYHVHLKCACLGCLSVRYVEWMRAATQPTARINNLGTHILNVHGSILIQAF
jgi:hypothetical protein